MSPPERNSKLSLPWLCLLVTGFFFGGCSFIPNHSVAVDAISGLTSPIGPAYRLADHDPMVVRDSAQHKRVFGCVAAALETKGVYEAVPPAKPDFIVEIDYGALRGAGFGGASGMAPMTEYYLQLSARRPRTDGLPGKGEEVWNVRVSVTEDQADFTTLMPVLAAVAADYAGLDTQIEKTIKVSDKEPKVMHVRSVVGAVR
jgi:hypothetical protein